MYEAEYDYDSDHKNILSFKTGEKFVMVHSSVKVRVRCGWIYVIDAQLKCGYVPETYVKRLKDEETDGFVSQLTSMLKQAVQKCEDDAERHKYQKLLAEVQQRFHSGTNPRTTNAGGCGGAVEPVVKNCNSVPTPEDPILDIPTSVASDEQPSLMAPDMIGCELIEFVKRETSLSHKQARGAAEAVLAFLGERFPSVRAITSTVIVSIKGTSPCGEALENTLDWTRLRCIFSTILDVKSDVEQLNWALYEDQHIIIEFLEELILLLTDGDPVVCKRFLHKDQHRNVESLVQYFHMETRLPIRQILLRVFAALCALDRLSISVLVNSELPLLLAQDIQESNHELQRLTYSCLLLTMLMWTGETMPVNHYDVLNANFVNFILDLMDNPMSDDEAEQIADCCTELLLAFNLQFKEAGSNIVLQALQSRSTAKEFLEKLIILVNREDEPVGAMFEHDPRPPNSVHKALMDILGSSDTANLFYQNDLKVLIEIIGRKLMDSSPDDEIQTSYLLIAYNIICNTDYADHGHCRDELQQYFDRILQDDVADSIEESRTIVRKICSKFPELFHDA